ncbi:transglutaminase family protein [Stappia sp. F7233]|uniref:Transglutaminase family protein n=1 Tax=Stappia albiluteola TaxID=2758565 RepID=A0A839ACB7_9HYPH|nr:transglutaminase family protein [Stappia albiluteola]MBA5777111.1 transglutaminase family protein [Stappia albiluteola]
MLYDIGLKILHEYESPASGGRHLLRLMPADLPGEQRLVAGHLNIEPQPAERREGTDFFGNPTVEIAYRFPHDEIRFEVQARVERLAEAPVLNMSPCLGGLVREIGCVRSLGSEAPIHFTGRSDRVRLNAEMTAFARELVGPDMTVVDAVRAIGTGLHEAMRYDPEATTVETTAEEAFRRRHGVCQDYSHIMIACLRGIGIPAGYVSGFLRTIAPEGQARLEGADAMHAWVRAWCGVETGWIEFDPTNSMFVDTDHIVIARGRDYSDVAPVKGVLRSAGRQSTDHSVDVVPVAVSRKISAA